MDKPPIKETEDGVVIEVMVQPRASRDQIVGLHGDAIKIRLTAPPAEGKANAALIAFLSKKLGVPKSSITILRGKAGRRKSITVSGITLSDARRILNLFG